jgi:lipopolysaccharide exporter
VTTDTTPLTLNRVARGLGWSTTGNLVLRLGSVLTSVIMARLIAPDQFGVFAVALTVWSILGTVAEFGLGADLVRTPDLEGRAPTVATLGALSGVLFGALMALGAPLMAEAFDSPESVGVIQLMAISLVVFGFTIVPAARLNRAYRQGALFAINGAGLLASTTVMTTLALHGVGPASLAWGQIANQTVILVGLYVVTRTWPRFGLVPRLAWESARFCLPLAMANLLSWLLLSIDNLIVARVMGPTALGLYALAFNVSSWPMTAIGQSIRVVALPAFSQVGTPDVRNRALVRVSGPVTMIAVFMAVSLSILAVPLITFLYGERWLGAATALSALAVFGGLRVMIDLIATFLIAAGTTTAVLVVQVLWLIAMVPAMLVGVRLWGLAGAGWTHLAVALAVVLPAYLACLRRVGVGSREFLRGWLLPMAAVIPAALASWWVVSLAAPPFLTMVSVGAILLMLYIAPLARWWLGRVKSLQIPIRSTQEG